MMLVYPWKMVKVWAVLCLFVDTPHKANNIKNNAKKKFLGTLFKKIHYVATWWNLNSLVTGNCISQKL